MAKELNVTVETQEVIKGLAFTKKDYEYLAANAMESIKLAKRSQAKPEELSSLYGIFYSSMAGLVRSGALCSLEDGIDGFPELHVLIGENKYHCKEYAIQAILGDEASEIISPYENKCGSYITPATYINAETNSVRLDDQNVEAEQPVKTKRGKYQRSEADKRLIDNLNQKIAVEAEKHAAEITVLKQEKASIEMEKTSLEKELANISEVKAANTELQTSLAEATQELALSLIHI